MGYEKKPRLGGDRRWSRMVPIVYLDRKGFRVSSCAMSLKAGTHCAQDRRKFSRSVRQPTSPMTVTIQIGNSDDKLSQADWSRYVETVASHIEYYAEDNGLTIHFFAASEGTQRWQNAAWVLGAHPEVAAQLKAKLAGVRTQYQQDSLAWAEGETQFI